MDMKACSRCNESKPLSEFPEQRTAKGSVYLHSRCRACRREQCREWAKTKQGKAVKRSGILRREFRMSECEYGQMHDAQGGVCAICGRAETKVHRDGSICRLSVDHDHVSGDVRGLLCSKCNVGLGFFEDNPESLRKAADYIQSRTSTQSAQPDQKEAQ